MKVFRISLFLPILLLATSIIPDSLPGQVLGTDFTYQGQLKQGGALANGNFNFSFLLFTAASGGSQVGSTVNLSNVAVSEGLFTVELDFGASAFNGSNRWLEVRVNGIFLSPRQPLNGTPYALQTRGLFVNQSESFVGVGRDFSITGVEAFGIESPATSSFGGMYINTSGIAGLPFYGYATGGVAQAFHYYEPSSGLWRLSIGGSTRLVVSDTGMVGIGTSQPNFALNVAGSSDTSPTGGGLIVAGTQIAANVSIDANEIMARDNNDVATLFLNHEGGNVSIGQQSGGTTRLITPVLQITGGSDFAEMFDVRHEGAIEPGMLVSIDPQNPGQLVLTSGVHDRRVAGIISGAGGVATGMTMGHTGTVADGKYPIALSGRVYCLVDAREQAVQPGDLLTTSTHPGHAIKAMDLGAASGAIIGKAMSPLDQGQIGLVLVLVNLQ